MSDKISTFQHHGDLHSKKRNRGGYTGSFSTTDSSNGSKTLLATQLFLSTHRFLMLSLSNSRLSTQTRIPKCYATRFEVPLEHSIDKNLMSCWLVVLATCSDVVLF